MFRRKKAGPNVVRSNARVQVAAAVTVEAMERRVMLTATPSMVKDIDQSAVITSTPSAISDGGGGTVFFKTAQSDLGTNQVYRSDGTSAGTTAVPGAVISSPVGSLLASGNTIVYGSTTGTYLGSTTLATPATSPVPVTGKGFAFTGDGTRLLYVQSGTPTPDGEKGYELWGTGGFYKDINPGAASSSPAELVTIGGVTYFSADDGTTGRELWRSDGTVAGTTRVKDIFPGSFGSSPVGLTNVNGTLYFFACNSLGAPGAELWKSDGTEAGTVRVATVNSAPYPTNVGQVTVAGGRLFFTAYNSTEFWTSDGTTAGTARLTQFGAAGRSVSELVGTSSGTAYFNVGGATTELWKSDGTLAGTSAVGTFVGLGSLATPTTGDVVYFAGATPNNGSDQELWKSDGTATGTTRVKDVNAGPVGSGVSSLTRSGALMYFCADDGTHGGELWKTDGTAEGTVMVFDADTGLGGDVGRSDATGSVLFRGSVFFDYTGSQPNTSGLWRTDGTAEGTVHVLSDVGRRVGLSVVNDKLFWAEPSGSTSDPYTLRAGDGTAAGTITLATVKNPANFTLSGDGSTLYFSALTSASGNELWKTDGTAAGTGVVRDIQPGAANTLPTALTAVGNTLFFYANTPATGYELWKSDGTTAGTVMVKDIVPGTTGSALGALHDTPGMMVNANGTLYFYASSPSGMLWKSDGTDAGTVPVPISGSGATFGDSDGRRSFSFKGFATLGGSVYFFAEASNPNDPQASPLLYLFRTDGTATGTQRLTVLGDPSETPFGMTTVDDSIYFFINEYASGWEFWRATSGGATRLYHSDRDQSYPGSEQIVKAGSSVYVGTTRLSDVNTELLQTDGTPVGTTFVDLNPTGASTPTYLTAGPGDSLFFTANDGVHGREVWRTPPTAVAAPPPPATSLSATTVSAARVDLSWTDNSTDEIGFRVERSSDPSFATIDQSFYLLADTTTFSDTTTASNVTYYYRVVTYNAGGDAATPSNTATATTPSTPRGPTNLKVLSSSEPTGRLLGLSWTDDSNNETSFRLERSRSADFSTIEQTFAVPANTTTFTDTTGLSPATQYYYRLFAVNASGDSSPSTASGWTNPAPSPAPTGLVAWGSSPTRIELQWNDVTTFKFNWVIERSDNGGPFKVIASPQPVTPPHYGDTTVQPGNTYAYRVSATGQPTDVSNVATATSLAETLPTPVTDVNAKPIATGSDPSAVVVSNGIGYFAATTNDAGRELWRTDGTAAGTVRVADVLPGTASSNPTNLFDFNGTLYFAALDSTGKSALWTTDGTAAGTVLVKAIGVRTNTLFAKVGAFFYFAAAPAKIVNSSDVRLWKSDGTTAGTTMLGTSGFEPATLTPLGDRLLFTADFNSTFDREAWITDGTAQGTFEVLDIQQLDSSNPSILTPFVVVGDNAFFSGAGPAGPELWKTDGTTSGTVLVKDIWAEQNYGSQPRNLVAYNGLLYFTAYDRDHDRSLWRSDGTAAGTVLVKDFVEPVYSDPPGSDIWVANGKLFMRIMDANGTDTRLYASDGTDAGTQFLMNLPYWGGNNDVGVVGQTLVGVTNNKVWATDDTPGGSSVSATLPGAETAFSLGKLGDVLFFGVNEPTVGKELWRTDGTAAGTSRLKDINDATADATPASFIPSGNVLYFIATGTDGLRGLFRTDGTGANTVRVATGNVTSIVAASAGDGSALFATQDSWVVKLWSVAAGASTATLVSDTLPTTAINKLYVVGSRVYFRTRGTDNALQLWTSDGTAAGTARVSDVVPVDPSTGYAEPIAAGGYLYFAATTTAAGIELWRTDGTAAGTTMVYEVNPGTAAGGPYSMTAIGSRVYFVGNNPTNLWSLWQTDGTAASTVLVNDGFNGGTGSPAVRNLTSVGAKLFFTGATLATGAEPWSSDGTTAGTVPIADLLPGTSASDPSGFTDSGGGIVFFSATDAQRGRGLYRSDGTAAGTVRVKDLTAQQPAIVATGNGNVLYSDAGAYWMSNGATTGTVFLAQVNPGTNTSDAGTFAVAAGRAYFRVNDGTHGQELWTLDVSVRSSPSLVQPKIDDGTAQRSQIRSITIPFDRPVVLAPGALKLQLLNTGGSGLADNSAPTDASAVLGTPTTSDGGVTWVVTFVSGNPFMQTTTGGVPTGSLVDGVYTFTIDPTKVTANGVQMAAPVSVTFHRLFGDQNGNKTTNNGDYALFRNAFLKSAGQAGFDAAFDFDGNGVVNNLDYGQFRSRFLKVFAY